MDRLVPVESFFDIPTARVVQSYLAQHGLLVFLFDDELAQMKWTYLTALSGVRVMVLERELEAAQALLADRDESLKDGGVDHCAVCNSGDVFRQPSWFAAIIGLLTTGQILPVPTARRRFRACGHQWSEANASAGK
jgi:hypothetical protein